MISTKREGRRRMANQGSHEYLADKQPLPKAGGFGLRLRTGSIGEEMSPEDSRKESAQYDSQARTRHRVDAPEDTANRSYASACNAGTTADAQSNGRVGRRACGREPYATREGGAWHRDSPAVCSIVDKR
jgi:hypothetical protein